MNPFSITIYILSAAAFIYVVILICQTISFSTRPAKSLREELYSLVAEIEKCNQPDSVHYSRDASNKLRRKIERADKLRDRLAVLDSITSQRIQKKKG